MLQELFIGVLGFSPIKTFGGLLIGRHWGISYQLTMFGALLCGGWERMYPHSSATRILLPDRHVSWAVGVHEVPGGGGGHNVHGDGGGLNAHQASARGHFAPRLTRRAILANHSQHGSRAHPFAGESERTHAL